MIKNPYTYMREHPYEIGLIDPDSNIDAIKQFALYEHTGLSPANIADLQRENAELRQITSCLVWEWDNGHIEPYSPNVKDYIDRLKSLLGKPQIINGEQEAHDGQQD